MDLTSVGIGFWVIVGLMILCVALLASFLASLYRKAGPHEALVVYGFRGTRIVKGHGTVIFPMIESYRQLPDNAAQVAFHDQPDRALAIVGRFV